MHDEIKPNWLSEIVRRFSVFIYTVNGWTAVQENPPPRKAVIIAAPHTSNWDFLFFFRPDQQTQDQVLLDRQRQLIQMAMGGHDAAYGRYPGEQVKVAKNGRCHGQRI